MNPTLDIGEEKTDRVAADGVVRKDDVTAAETTHKANKEPIKLLGVQLPDSISASIRNFQGFWDGLRKSTIAALPAFIVNHSSNAIGATQMVGEVLYAKSSGVTLIPDKTKNIGHQIFIQPAQSIFNTVFGRAKFEGKLSDWLKPSHVKSELVKFVDLKQATQIDGVNHTVKLINRWSSRSGFAGIVSMAVATIFPDEKESEETILENGRLRQSNLPLYLATRLFQAVWFPAEVVIRGVKKVMDPQSNQHIGEHKRQFAGLGMTFTGIFSVISGLRQVEGKFERGQKQHYMRNPWQMLGGAITTVAGQMLMNAVDNQKGWSNYGNIQFLRLAPLIPSITTRFRPGPNGLPEQGADWYLAAQGVFQGKNAVASLIGGAEKRQNSDGTVTIIDHKAIREKARIEGIELKKNKRELKYHNDNDVVANDNETIAPSTKVTAVAERQNAMPERVEAKKQALAEATV